MTNGIANPVVIPLLKSRAGRRLGRRLAVVEYVGRRTGRRHRLVAAYTLHGVKVHFTVGVAERKTWWRNFQDPHPVQLRLAGRNHDALARATREGDQVRVTADLALVARPPFPIGRQ